MTNEQMTTGAGWRRVRLWLLGTLLACAALELAVRLPLVYTKLPPPLPYFHPGVETRRRALEQVLARAGEVDVLFAGSSIVRTNLIPSVFDAAVREHAGLDIVSFNAGLSGILPDPTRVYLKEFWLARARPRAVVQGVRLFSLAHSAPAAHDQTLQLGRIERLWTSPSLPDTLVARAISSVRLSQYQGTLRRALDQLQAGEPLGALRRNTGFPIDERGWEARRASLAEVRATGRLDRRRPYATPLASEPFEAGIEALRRTAALCRERGILYIVANSPEHPYRYSTPDGAARYRHYLGLLEDLAAQEGFVFIDVTNGDPGRFANDAWFSDYHHMLPAGAERFTSLLAARLAPLLAGDGERWAQETSRPSSREPPTAASSVVGPRAWRTRPSAEHDTTL